MNRRRLIRTCVLFGGMTLSLASVPMMLERVESMRTPGTLAGLDIGGQGSLPDGVDVSSLVLAPGGQASGNALDRARSDGLVLIGPGDDTLSEEERARLVREAERRRLGAVGSPPPGVTKVLGPDD